MTKSLKNIQVDYGFNGPFRSLSVTCFGVSHQQSIYVFIEISCTWVQRIKYCVLFGVRYNVVLKYSFQQLIQWRR